MSKTAELIQCRYCAIGHNLMTSVLEVIFEVGGETYTHKIPNPDWSYQNPSLQFMGYVGICPTDFKGKTIELDGEVEVAYNEKRGPYLIKQQIFIDGAKKLAEAKWFNDEGEVWDSRENMAFGGMSVDPNTGNKAGVPVDGEDEN